MLARCFSLSGTSRFSAGFGITLKSSVEPQLWCFSRRDKATRPASLARSGFVQSHATSTDEYRFTLTCEMMFAPWRGKGLKSGAK